jgi:hypothetical protein
VSTILRPDAQPLQRSRLLSAIIDTLSSISTVPNFKSRLGVFSFLNPESLSSQLRKPGSISPHHQPLHLKETNKLYKKLVSLKAWPLSICHLSNYFPNDSLLQCDLPFVDSRCENPVSKPSDEKKQKFGGCFTPLPKSQAMRCELLSSLFASQIHQFMILKR